jgi:hypothetical protein
MSRVLSAGLAFVLLSQSVTGLLFADQYRDVDWIRAAWFGNDWVTLLVALPMLAGGVLRETRGSARGMLLWLGTVGYALYNYAFYLLGAALNIFFPLYVISVLLATIVLMLALPQVDVVGTAARFRSTMPVRAIGGALIVVGGGLGSVWIGMWAAYVFAGQKLPVDPEIFRLVAALDLLLMMPALVTGGMLLWQRKAWGYVVAAIAGIQSSLYLLVLAVNSAIAVRRGLADPPGEFPVWGTLTALMSTVMFVFYANLRVEPISKGP